jgi:hypothetical protein
MNLRIIRFFERTPVVRALYWRIFERWRVARERRHWSTLPPGQVFQEIYATNRWRDAESRSGTGSNLRETETLRRELAGLFARRGIRSLADIPCGDFHWMSQMSFSGRSYLGGDIVPEIIYNNRAAHSNPGVRFEVINLIENSLPSADLLICRDCLVHFSFSDIFRALNNIFRADIGFILTTTFPATLENRDIVTGEWRMINLERPPFALPPPLELIGENCRESAAAASKGLGLWEISTLRRHAASCGWPPR